MDLKGYFQKIREVESKIDAVFPVIVSLETADGGVAGVLTEVTASLAAKMIVEGVAKLATLEQSSAFQKAKAAAKQTADEIAAAAKLTFSVISSAEQKLGSIGQPQKKQE
jgi:hypothetical protein